MGINLFFVRQALFNESDKAADVFKSFQFGDIKADAKLHLRTHNDVNMVEGIPTGYIVGRGVEIDINWFVSDNLTNNLF